MISEEIMSTEDILRDIASLPPEAQRQVADFIALLLSRYARSKSPEHSDSSHPATDNFIGMWQDRVDLQNSNAWVRMVREREWERS
jgi:hypothetical protein